MPSLFKYEEWVLQRSWRAMSRHDNQPGGDKTQWMQQFADEEGSNKSKKWIFWGEIKTQSSTNDAQQWKWWQQWNQELCAMVRNRVTCTLGMEQQQKQKKQPLQGSRKKSKELKNRTFYQKQLMIAVGVSRNNKKYAMWNKTKKDEDQINFFLKNFLFYFF